MDIINSYNLYFNTKNRTSGTPDYCTFNLLTPLILTSNMDTYFRVSLTNLEIPFAWTSLRNCSLVFIFWYGSTMIQNTITIPNGNYTIITLLAQISTLLAASILITTNQIRTFNFTFNNTFQKASFDFGTISNPGDSLEMVLTTNSSTLFLMLGLVANVIFYINALSVHTIASSVNNVNCNPLKSLYFRSDNLISNNNFESVVSSTNKQSDIIQKIRINTPPNTYIQFNPAFITHTKISASEIDNIVIYISDDLSTGDDSITTMKLDWTFSLLIEEVINKNNKSFEDNKPLTIIQPKPETNPTIMELNKKKEELMNKIKDNKQLLTDKINNTKVNLINKIALNENKII